jgi:tape measure domain-containing protein
MDDTEKHVVELELDNTNFEKNAKQSINTVDKLKDSLNFDDVAESAKKLTAHFSAMEIAGITAISNITNRVVNLGIRLVKSLSVDNIATGWYKFGDKTKSVATMAAQNIKIAGKEITGATEKLEAINEQLEKLNWFSDETSYTFTDMVDNVGKFTAAGIELDKAVNAMMGIANWAALSGQNASTASRAMYQLAQAMGKGKIQLIDYKSIQNANMDTQEFRKTVLDTATAMNELTKEGDKFKTKTGKTFTQNQFTEQLSEGWFTSDVLVKSLEKYSAAIDKIYKISKETGLTSAQVMARYSEELDGFGLKAFKAAQEARTFSDTINAIKDAVSSGWLQTAEKIFGSYKESAELWTELANKLYDLFAEGGNFRNTILGIWRDIGGRSDLFARGSDNQGAFWNIYDAIVNVVNIFKTSFREVFSNSIFESQNDQAKEFGKNLKSLTYRLKEMTANFKAMTESKTANGIKNILKAVLELSKYVIYTMHAALYAVQPIYDLFKKLFSTTVNGLSDMANTGRQFTEYLEVVNKTAIKINNSLRDLLNYMNIPKIASEAFVGISSALNDFAHSLKSSGGTVEAITDIFEGFVSAVMIACTAVGSLIKVFSKALMPVATSLLRIFSNIAGALGGIVSTILGFVGKIFSELNAWLSGSDIQEKLSTIPNLLENILNHVYELKPVLSGLLTILKNLINILLLLPKTLNNIVTSITGNDIATHLANALSKITDFFVGLKKELIKANDVKKSIASSIGRRAGKKNRIMAPSAATGSSKVEVPEELSPWTTFINGLYTFASALIPLGEGLIKVIGQGFGILGKAIGSIGEGLKSFVLTKDLEFKPATQWLIHTTLGIIAVAVAMKSLLTIIRIFSGLSKNLSDLMNSTRKYVDTKRIKEMANMLMQFGVAMIGISTAMAIIATIPNDKLWQSVAVMGTFLVVLTAAIFAISKISNTVSTFSLGAASLKEGIKNLVLGFDTTAAKIKALSTIVLSIGASMMLLALAFKQFEAININTQGIIIGLITLGSLILTMITISLLSSKTASIGLKASTASFITLIALAVMIKSFADAVKELTTVKWDDLWKSTLMLTGFMVAYLGMMAVVMLAAKKTNDAHKVIKSITTGFGIINASLVIFAYSISLLNSIDWTQSTFSIIAAAGMIVVYMIAIGIIAKCTEKSDPKTIGTTLLGFIAISESLVLFARALTVLSGINYDNINNALGALSALLATFGAILIGIEGISKWGNPEAIRATMLSSIAMVASISILLGETLLIKELMDRDYEGTKSALIALGILMAVLAISVAIIAVSVEQISSTKGKIATVISIMAFIGGIIGGVIALTQLIKDMDPLLIVAYFGMLSVAFLSLGKSISIILKSGKNVTDEEASRSLRAVLAVSALIVAIGGSLKLMGNIPWYTILAACGGFALVLLSLAAATKILANIETSFGDAAGTLMYLAGGMVLLSAAMIVFAYGIKEFSTIEWDAIGRGLTVLAASMAALIVLAVVGSKLKATTESMIAFGASVTLMGAGLLMTAMSIMMLINGLSILSGDLTSNIANITANLTALTNVITDVLFNSLKHILDESPSLFSSLFNAIYEFVAGLSEMLEKMAPTVTTAVAHILASVLTVLDENKEDIIDKVFSIFTYLVGKLGAFLQSDEFQSLVDGLVKTIIKLFEALTTGDNLAKIVNGIVNFIVALFQGADKIIDALVDFIFNIISKMLVELPSKLLDLARSAAKIFLSFVATILSITIASLGSLSGMMIAFVGGLLKILWSTVKGFYYVIKATLKTIFVDILRMIVEIIKDGGPLIMKTMSVFALAFANSFLGSIRAIPWLGDILGHMGIDGAIESIDGMIKDTLNSMSGGMNDIDAEINRAGLNIKNSVSKTTKSISNSLSDGIKEINDTVSQTSSTALNEFAKLGGNLIDGLVSGTDSNSSKVTNSIQGLADNAIDTWKTATDTHSPSRVFKLLGSYIDAGLVEGIRDDMSSVDDAITKLAETALLSANDIIDDGLDNTITITPVLDLSKVQNGASNLSALMKGVDGISLTADLASKSIPNPSKYINRGSSEPTSTNNKTINNETYNNTFNIQGNDPKEIAEEVDQILQKRSLRRRAANG